MLRKPLFGPHAFFPLLNTGASWVTVPPAPAHTAVHTKLPSQGHLGPSPGHWVGSSLLQWPGFIACHSMNVLSILQPFSCWGTLTSLPSFLATTSKAEMDTVCLWCVLPKACECFMWMDNAQLLFQLDCSNPFSCSPPAVGEDVHAPCVPAVCSSNRGTSPWLFWWARPWLLVRLHLFMFVSNSKHFLFFHLSWSYSLPVFSFLFFWPVFLLGFSNLFLNLQELFVQRACKACIRHMCTASSFSCFMTQNVITSASFVTGYNIWTTKSMTQGRH